MEQQFDAVLTGSDSDVNGIVTPHANGTYEFNSLDESLQLVIARNEDGQWERIAGTDPYFSGWIDQLVEQIKETIRI